MIEPFYYRLLPDLPSPPQWLINLVDLDAVPDQPDLGYAFPGAKLLDDWKGKSYETVHPRLKIIPDDFQRWVKENITEEFLLATAMFCPADQNMPSIGAHTDGVREFALLYNIKAGGPNTRLEFWQEKGFPLIRERKTQVLTTKNLTLVETLDTPTHCWYLLDGRILHSIENLTECRVNLQVSFEKTLPDNLLSMAKLNQNDHSLLFLG